MNPSRAAACTATIALALSSLALTPASAADTDPLTVDFATRTGDFRGGSTGTLYGFGDEGAPTQALINGARITNSSQKPPFGTQHPSGDALKIEDGFFAKHGEDLYVYVQDYYPDWPYYGGTRPGDTRTYNLQDGTFTNGANGIWDYLEVVEFVTEAIATGTSFPDDYVLIPFNEPDGIWYQNWGTMRDQFLQDWDAVYAKIQEVWARHGLGHARIGGPGDSRWYLNRSTDLLNHTKASNTLPDVFIWHELGINNLASFPANFAAYRSLEQSVGIDPLPINITEYGMLRDMSTPGQLVQWFSMFENAKVDAQTAYWNYAGNFSDNSARPNGANAGWWFFKWYGDLAGGETVQVTPPSPNTVDTLQGIAAIDDANKRATVLWGGTEKDVALNLTGLDTSAFGASVDVEVREITLSGAQGLSGTPRLVAAIDDVPLTGGALQLTVPTYDRYAGYQLIVTPGQDRDVAATLDAQPWTISEEVENLALTGAQTFFQNPQANGGWKFLASGSYDVGAFNTVGSKADWTVEVPADGTYRLQVIGATPGVPGRHALFVDGQSRGIIQYTADLALTNNHRWQYRGSSEVLVDLTAGQHVLSIRASQNGTSLLPNADITLDKVSLTSVGDGEPTVYPASTFRLANGAALDWQTAAGSASLSGNGRADLYATAMDSGYYDLVVDWTSTSAAELGLALNGRDIASFDVDGSGRWTSTVRAHLAEGINEIELTGTGGALVGSVTTVRATEADSAIVTIEAENARKLGAARTETLAASTGTNVSGGAYAGWIGNGTGNAIEIDRQAGFNTPGDYDLTVYYTNAELQGNHSYNPQVVDRRLDVSEGGTNVGHGYFRYTFSWNSFWQRTIPVTLSTPDAALRFYASHGYGPNVDKVSIAPAIVGTPGTVAQEQDEVDVEVWLANRCVAGRSVLAVRLTNNEDAPAEAFIQTSYGSKQVASLAAGASVSHAFSTRQAQTAESTVTVTGTVGGRSFEKEATAESHSCS
ncbi:MAG TPA: hypothetical protein PKE40_11295 [Arachnia sp.]|nr:hypothetical protein [Arachnia sp.]HMT86929.1 hypothetical protein [Arachnia sp.]